jgi:hypothetical protein
MCVSIKYRNYLSLFYSCCCHHSGKWPNLLLWQLAKIWKLASMLHWIPTAIIFKIFNNFFVCQIFFKYLNIFSTSNSIFNPISNPIYIMKVAL